MKRTMAAVMRAPREAGLSIPNIAKTTYRGGRGRERGRKGEGRGEERGREK